MSDPIITVKHLVKEFKTYDRREGVRGAIIDLFARRHKTVRAVDDISFEIHPGETVGYIGANGAGKSTTIKVLCGILFPTSGDVRVAGRVPWLDREEHTRTIGAVFGQRSQLWWDLAAGESLRLLARMYGVEEKEYQKRLDDFDEVLKLKEFLKTPARKLSLGQRMRCELAASLIHDPRIVFLDEPTIGLDVAVKHSMRDFVRRLARERGATIILTTHDLRDIEELCSRIMMIDKGRLVFDGTVEALKEKALDTARIVFTLAHECAKDWKPDGLPQTGVLWQADGAKLTAVLDKSAPPRAEVIRAALEKLGAEVEDIAIAEPQIEQIVRRLYENAS